MEKYLKGVSSKTKEFQLREHVDDLRADMQKQIHRANKSIKAQRELDVKEKDQIKDFANKLNEEVEDNWASYDQFRDEIKEFYGESNFREFKKCMSGIIALKNKISEEDRKSLKNSKDRVMRDKLRLFSFFQIWEICNHVVVESELTDRISKNEGEMKGVYTYLDELRRVDLSMREYIDTEIDKFRTDFVQSIDAQATTNKATLNKVEKAVSALAK